MKPFHLSSVRRVDNYGKPRRRKAVTCELCGESETLNKNSICNPCQHTWMVGKAYKEHVDEQRESGDAITGILPRHPSVSRRHALGRKELEEKYPDTHGWLRADGELMDLLIDLAGIAKVGDSWRGSKEGTRYLYVRDDTYPGAYTGTPEQFEALQKAFDLVCFLMENEYKEGYRTGNSVIGRLAAGDLTVNEINELEIKQGLKQ